MDVAVDKNIKRNESHLQKQKKDKTHYHLDQDSIKAKLADTYIFNSAKKKDIPPHPTNNLQKNLTKYKKILVIIAFLLIGFVTLFIIKEAPVELNVAKNIDKKLFGVDNNIVSKNALILTNLNFYGNSSENSKLTQEYIYLAKKRGSKISGVEIKFENPIENFSGSLNFLAKGEGGEEKLIIILKDTSSSENKELKLTPHFGNLSQDWQKVIIPFDKINENGILTKITSVAFEVVDSKKISAKAACYVKDIVLLNK